MKRRSLQLRQAALAGGLALAVVLALGPLDSQAGIFRDMLDWVSPKPHPPPGSAPTVPWQGFACCNLHYDHDTINDGNYSELPMIPAGTAIEVLSYDDGHYRAAVKVDGKPMKLGLEFGRSEESLEAWVGKIVVTDDPRPRIKTYSQGIRDAIYEGKVIVGMTREQAIIAIGYPITSENITLDGPVWRLWHSRRGEYQLNFRPDGHLGSVTGDDSVTSLIVYKPQQ
jgi:hypothetical protein